MVDLSVATEHSRANDPGVLDLREFPALADLRMVGSGGEVRQQVVDVAIGDKQGLGYLASALGKPLYTDRATALKQHLDFAKICVDVEAMFDLPSAITVDLGNGNCVEVGVELDWAPPKCSHCAIFGHTLDNCKKMILSNECYQGDSSCFLKGVESDVIVPKVGTAGAVGDVMSDSVEGLANGKVADGMVAGVVNESVNAEVVGGVVVGSDGDVAVAIGAGVYDASIEVVVAVDSVVSASSGDVGSAAFLKEIELGVPVLGNPLQVLFAKLKRLKEPLKKFNKEKFGGISNRVLQKRVEYENIQNSLLVSPSIDLILQERVVRNELRNLERAEEMFYLQKSRVQYVREGDQNTAFFFKRVAVRQKKSTIQTLQNKHGQKLDTFEAISAELVDYFSDSLGVVDGNVEKFPDGLIQEILGCGISEL
ncbi:hypothetical protein V6N13_044215 [Hibiscus sabdariffa]